MTFSRLLSEAIAAPQLPTTGDVLAVGLPFLRQIDDLHAAGRVTTLYGTDSLVYEGAVLSVQQGASQVPQLGGEREVREFNPESTRRGVEVESRVHVDHGTGNDRVRTSLDVFDEPTGRPERPMLVVGYRAWEQLYGRHDELTDIHLAGLVLVSYASGLDFDLPDAVHDLAFRRRHIRWLNQSVHPVVAGVLSDMVDPDRHARPSDLGQVIARLEHHRELPDDLDLEEAYQSTSGWRTAVLTTLRERVFDLSRRNRALYFRPTATALSLTEASVPLMLNVERIKPDELLTWTGAGAKAFRSGKPVDLERWCRFEEAPHLAPGLDKTISNERKLRTEHGQGRLRLVIAFLRWFDPEAGEVVHSPLLTMPAELSRKKGVRNRYLVQVDSEAEVNPVLRHVFKSRFGITLPTTAETDHESIVALISDLETAVRATDPSIEIELIDTPRVSIIRRRAKLRVDAYLRRRAQARAATGRWRRQDHSYDRDDWRPLGLALYRRFVRPADLPLRDLTGAAPRLRGPDFMSAPASPATGERVSSNFHLSASDVHAHRWEVDLCAVTLASLGSRRTSLSRDYETLLAQDGLDDRAAAESDGPPTPFDALFSPEPKTARGGEVSPISLDQPLVLPADDAQARAVRRGVRGDSFIIQGPPGTGKSQTIANLIAALVAEGRRVLFVCEKRAALDVVAHRLEQVGLGELVATIHDSQLDRKAFIGDLRATYEDWLIDREDDPAEARADLLAGVQSLLVPLERAFTELHDARGGRRSLSELIERLVLLRSRGVGAVDAPEAAALDVDGWFAARPGLDRVASGLVAAGRPDALGRSPVLRLAPERLAGGDPVVLAREAGASLAAAVDAFRAATGPVDPAAVHVEGLAGLADAAPLLAALAERDAIAVFDRQSGAHLDLRAAATTLDRLGGEVDTASAVLDWWREPLGAADARAALQVARDKEDSALRFLNGRWRKTKRVVREQYRFELHQIEPATSEVLVDLVAWHNANDAVAAQRADLLERYGADDTWALLAAIDGLDGDPVVAALVADRGAVDAAGLGRAAVAFAAESDGLIVAAGTSVADLGSIADDLGRASIADERALISWADLASTDRSILIAVLGGGRIDEVERAVLEAALDRAGASGALAAMTGAQLDHTVDLLLERYRELLVANAGLVAGRVRERFREHVVFSEASMAGRPDDDKEAKRAYAAGRRVLEREFQKKMRFRSIRELADGDPGLVVRDLKPVWLMSPLSVSDTLPLDDELFDVVVFDEASQIPVEDAVPTLFRARQAVVVGDRMQLPPTRFFSADVEDDEDGLAVDADGHRITVTLDADSFLTQADLALESSMLTWHYRSRFESLIAYSNHAFYDARLATVPDRGFDGDERPEIVVAAAEDAPANLGELLARPISFHRVENGRYVDRRNEAEADYIAEMVRALLRSGEGVTIGVVAFSEAQQTAIELSLAELALLDPSFGELLEDEQVRTDDGEFVGLFVKNLENVQGDERDVIIMSVCYGPAPDGKMRMNFGPINQSGGERRLNVIFSRAKQHMAIVSTITGADITNTHNDGAAHLARFLDYARAESRGGSGGDAVLRSLRGAERGGDADRVAEAEAQRSAVAVELAARLGDRGVRAEVGVGRSVFTVDVAVPGDDGYRLGVMIDPGRRETTTTARMVAEAGVLGAFGWPITRVFVSEWWTNPDQVVERIELLLRPAANWAPPSPA